MKVLAHIHTFNDEEVIEKAIEALMDQNYPLEEILIVDNASTDGTVDRAFPEIVKVIRHPVNTGTSGSVATGFKYALEKGHDWIWILDADSLPGKETLARLVTLYESFPPEYQREVGALASRILRGPTQEPDDYGLLTRKGPRRVASDADSIFYECDSGIWSGTLFKMSAVGRVDPPRYGAEGNWVDFGLDWGDIEYFHRMRLAGFKVLVHRQSTIRHALGWQRRMSILGRTVISTNHLPFRRYLYFRNGVYFWFYLYPDPHLPGIIFYLARHMASQIAKITMMEDEKLTKIWAILRGAWNGYRKKLLAPY